MKLNPTYQPNLFDGLSLRDKGIEVAEENAERIEPGWNEKCFEKFKEWLKGWPVGYQFLIEDFRLSQQLRGFEAPASKRVFGGLVKKAVREGLIKKAGYGQVSNPKAHAANCSKWEKI